MSDLTFRPSPDDRPRRTDASWEAVVREDSSSCGAAPPAARASSRSHASPRTRRPTGRRPRRSGRTRPPARDDQFRAMSTRPSPPPRRRRRRGAGRRARRGARPRPRPRGRGRPPAARDRRVVPRARAARSRRLPARRQRGGAPRARLRPGTARRSSRSGRGRRSRGTSPPLRGGVSSRHEPPWTAILRLSIDDMDVTVQAGVTRRAARRAPAAGGRVLLRSTRARTPRSAA